MLKYAIVVTFRITSIIKFSMRPKTEESCCIGFQMHIGYEISFLARRFGIWSCALVFKNTGSQKMIRFSRLNPLQFSRQMSSLNKRRSFLVKSVQRSQSILYLNRESVQKHYWQQSRRAGQYNWSVSQRKCAKTSAICEMSGKWRHFPLDWPARIWSQFSENSTCFDTISGYAPDDWKTFRPASFVDDPRETTA
jgi:hypothetical protein